MVRGKGAVNSISGNRVNSQVHEDKFEIVLCYTLDGIWGENSAQRDGFRLYMRFSAEARPVRISKIMVILLSKSLWRFNWCNSILIPSILAVRLPELARGLSKVLGKQNLNKCYELLG